MVQEELSSSPRVYEVGYHVMPSVPEEKLGAEVTAIKDILGSGNAVIISEEFPRLRPLAYAMEKGTAGKHQSYTSAYFGWIKFEADPSLAASLKEALSKRETILRFLIVKTVRENTMAAPRMAPRRVRTEIPAVKPGEPAVVSPISEEEIDRKIEQMIAE